MGDPTSLDRLADVVLPSPVAWWPPAPGWLVVGAVLVGLLLRAAMAAWERWRANVYRRDALAECRRLRAAADAASLPALVKRTALAAFPRERVASLSGTPWLAFLDETGRTHAFGDGPGGALVTLAYDPRAGAADAALFDVVEQWIREHRC